MLSEEVTVGILKLSRWITKIVGKSIRGIRKLYSTRGSRWQRETDKRVSSKARKIAPVTRAACRARRYSKGLPPLITRHLTARMTNPSANRSAGRLPRRGSRPAVRRPMAASVRDGNVGRATPSLEIFPTTSSLSYSPDTSADLNRAFLV